MDLLVVVDYYHQINFDRIFPKLTNPLIRSSRSVRMATTMVLLRFQRLDSDLDFPPFEKAQSIFSKTMTPATLESSDKAKDTDDDGDTDTD